MSENKIRSDALYVTPFSRAYWLDAFSQLKDVRMLCIAALMVALRIAMKNLFIPVGENLNIYFGFLVNALGASIFGPVVALIGGAVSDTLGAVVFPNGAYFFPFIFVEMLGSFVYGIFLWKTRLSATRIILSKFAVDVSCNFLLNPYIMILYYKFLNNGKSYKFITIPRIIKSATLFPVESFLLVLFIGAMTLPLVKLGLYSKEQQKPVMTKKHYIILGVLAVISAAVVIYKIVNAGS